MRRAALAGIVALIMIGTPLVAVAANTGHAGQAANTKTVVTLLDPLVNLPGSIVSLDFMSEKKGKLKHAPSADEDPMAFLEGKWNSLLVHLRFDGTDTDIDAEMAALLEFAKNAGRSSGPVMMTLVWGHLGAFDVEVTGLKPNAVNITHDHVYQHHQSDFEFLATHASAPSSPRAVKFHGEEMGVPVWMLDFAIQPTVNWSKHRESRADHPELEFTSADGRSMSFDLMFDGFEKDADIRPAVAIIVDHAFATPVRNSTIPMDFDWGVGPTLRGFILDASVEYTLFLPDATPVRAKVHIDMAGVHTIHQNTPPRVEPYAPAIALLDPDMGLAGILAGMDVWFNHSNDSHDMAVAWERHANADSKPLQFEAGKPMNMSFELLFDTYEPGGASMDLKAALGPLLNLTPAPNGDKRPPRVTFTWGGLPSFEGVVNSIDVKYTMFAEDGTPVRATCNITMRDGGRAQTREAEARGTDHNGTTTSAEGSTTHPLGKAEWANITLVGPMTGSREPMLDWVFAMANGTGSAMDMKVIFALPAPANGAWVCTQVTYTPPQFGPNGAEVDTITFRAEVTGLKEGEVPQFGTEFEKQICMIDATGNATSSGGDRHTRPDEFVKATGFTVDIGGQRSQADTLVGGQVTVALKPAANGTGHYRPGAATWGDITFTRQPSNQSSDWGAWYNATRKNPDGPRLNLTVNYTTGEGTSIPGFAFRDCYPVKWEPADLDSDQSGMAIERINITVEKVERA